MNKTDKQQVIIDEFDKMNDILYNFLKSCNVNPSSKTFYNMLKDLNKVIALKKDKKYIGLSVDNNGYITSYNNIDGIVEETTLPNDLTRGYYKYEKGKIVLDEEQMKKLWG